MCSAFSQADWPYSSHDAPSSSAFFLSPCEENQALLDYYQHQDLLSSHQFTDQENLPLANLPIKNPTNVVSTSLLTPDKPNKQKTPRKERSRSKILTAKGPRDRRVRFSVETSRKFFGLQDSLGFQKPSQTLDWLLGEAKPAIKELLRTTNIENNENARFLCSSSEDVGDSKKKKAASCKKRLKRKGKQKLGPEMLSAAKESRAKARQRARERTQEKNLLRNYIMFGNNRNRFGTSGDVLNRSAHEQTCRFQEYCLRMQRDLVFASGQVSNFNNLQPLNG